jgi:sulfate/thiosulfate transport system ATP-binding protein
MSIVLEQLTKRYEHHPVVNNVSLDVANGEFFVLLGPSGSGKSTILRMIAGLTSIDHGRIVLHDRDVTHLLPQQRGTGFVFQHYALFRHMTVGDNIEFALRIRKVSGAERRRRRDELLDLVGLSGLSARMPHQLSGGQQQRVALARALAHQPAVLLLDEPFGALDAKIRTDLRRTLKDVQRTIGMTTIFVTHDQEEAFELADRLGVMNAGRLLEVGPPEELYQRPQTEFVATFLGTANLLLGDVIDNSVRLGPLSFPLNTHAIYSNATQRVQVLFRPEDVALAPTTSTLHEPVLGEAEVEQATFVGSYERLRLTLPVLAGVQPVAPAVPFGSDRLVIEAMRSQDLARRFPLQPGDRAAVGVGRIHALPHPGLRILVVADTTALGAATLDLGSAIAQLAHARTAVLRYGAADAVLQSQNQSAKEQLGSGLPALETIAATDPPVLAITHETERQPYDLLIMGVDPRRDIDLLEQQLHTGSHHVLIVPGPARTPTRLLICVAAGEPGKEDVLFAGRLARQLGASATLLSIVPANDDRARAERFLQAGERALHTLNVPTQTVVRPATAGRSIRDEIVDEMSSGEHDLLVLGAPLRGGRRDGQAALAGVVGEVVAAATHYPVLIVKSRYAAGTAPWIGSNGRVLTREEVIR